MSHKQRVLELLSDHKPHSHHELYRLGCVAHSRISDLRKDGHLIRQWRENDLYLYQLEGVLDEAAHNAAASPRLSAASSSTPLPNPVEASSWGCHGAHDQDRDDEGVLQLFVCPIDESAGLKETA